MNEDEVGQNFDVLPSNLSEDSEDLDSRIAAQKQYYRRWAAERWLLCVYLRRCHRFLRSGFRPVKPVNNSADDELL